MRKVIIICFIIAICSCTHKALYDLPKPITDSVVTPVSKGNPNIGDSICFSLEIQPILISNCAKSGCHDDTTRQGGILLNTYSNLMATVSGHLLIQAITDKGELGMPQGAPLDSAQVALIRTWINQGMRNGIDCGETCDTTNVTFSGTIYPIIQNYCLGCHVTSTTVLTGYNNVKNQVLNGQLYCSVIQSSSCQPMPEGGPKLSACKLRQIKIWIDSGAPNN